MIELKAVFLDDPLHNQRIAELISQGWETRSGIKQGPVTGEAFPPYEVLVRYTEPPRDACAA